MLGSTTWFDVWMKHYLHSLPVSEFEYLKHVFGCIFVVSSSCNINPGTDLELLSYVLLLATLRIISKTYFKDLKKKLN